MVPEDNGGRFQLENGLQEEKLQQRINICYDLIFRNGLMHEQDM
jgi:hypothetical protein